jgi:hypothetical protein
MVIVHAVGVTNPRRKRWLALLDPPRAAIARRGRVPELRPLRGVIGWSSAAPVVDGAPAAALQVVLSSDSSTGHQRRWALLGIPVCNPYCTSAATGEVDGVSWHSDLAIK